jgi:hypothetical protein
MTGSISPLAREILARHARDPQLSVFVVLSQRSLDLPTSPGLRIYRLREPLTPGCHAVPSIDYDQLLELIFSTDTIVTWPGA